MIIEKHVSCRDIRLNVIRITINGIEICLPIYAIVSWHAACVLDDSQQLICYDNNDIP